MEKKLNEAEDIKSILEEAPPRLLKYLQNKKSEFVPNILKVSNIVEPLLNRISVIFPNYTLHDIKHSIRIMEYMFDLIKDISQLSELDICLLIYSALLHDIGMTATEDEINLVKEDKYLHSDIKYGALIKKYDNVEKLALQEYLRRIHAFRSSEFIKNNLKEFMVFDSQPSLNFYEDTCLICQSHTEDFQWVKSKMKSYNEKGVYKYNTQYCSILLRIADILDIDSNRTPLALYRLLNPKGTSNDEWKQHFIIQNRNKIKLDEKTGQKSVVFYGECSEANIHRKILRYMEWINNEIYHSNIITSKMGQEYQLNLKYPIDNNIEPKGYSISDLKLNIDFKTITRLLMGERIYGSKTYGLREVIQNSIDACEVRKEIEDKRREYGEDEYQPVISIILSSQMNQVIVKDNGTGMSFNILKNYFLNVGSSYYRSDDFLLRNYAYTPIGNFGIGFLSCFMLSNDVIVKTRYYNESKVYALQLTKESEYICLSEEDDVSFDGTEIILNYSEFMDVMSDKRDNIVNLIEKFFLSDVVKIRLIDRDNRFTYENTNKIYNLPICSESQYLIDLSEYLENSYGYIKIEIKKSIFVTDISSILSNDYLLYYNGSTLEFVSEEFDISLVCNNNKILYLEIPIIDDEDEYDRIFDVLDDEDETIEKMEEELKWATILINREYADTLLRDYSVYSRRGSVVKNLPLESLAIVGHCVNCPTKIYAKEIQIIYDHQNKTILPYGIKTLGRQHRSSLLMSDTDINVQLYLRNVYIKDSKMQIPNLISGIKIDKIKVNVVNNLVLADMSRNTIDSESETKLGYALGKAIHIWILNNITENSSQKLMIKHFIDMYYKEDNDMLKIIEICI